MKNKEIAQMLYTISELLSLGDENPFRIRAYEKAAQVIDSLPQDIEELSKKGELQKIHGIGESTAEKIREYLATGKMKYLDELKKTFPEGLIEIMSIPGMGPKKAKVVYEKLGISTVEKLKKYAWEGKLRDIDGFGEKTEKNILQGIELKQKSKGRILLFDALRLAESILQQMSRYKEIKQMSPAGSLRRRKESIGDIDILCTASPGKEKFVIDKFVKLPIVDKILVQGDTKASIISASGEQMDLRVLHPSQYGSALQYFTGSKEHNIALRELANKKGLTISEYGVFKAGKEKTVSRQGDAVAGETEEGIYKVLGLQYIPPVLRENRGEIELSKKKLLPKLVDIKDIKGDIHVHSKYSDGSNTINEIADKAEQLGLEWIIVCDHSQSLKVAHGTSVKDLHNKIDEIKRFNEKGNKKVKLLTGAEVDILSDGRLDYPDEILKLLDFVIIAVHIAFKQPEEQMTARIIKAMENKYVNALAHPSGRLIGKRNPYNVNLEKVLESAVQRKVMMEINAFPERLDLTDIYCEKAKELGLMMAIGTDAHSVGQMEYLPLGVYVAQRGWLEKKNVLNCLNHHQLIRLLTKYK